MQTELTPQDPSSQAAPRRGPWTVRVVLTLVILSASALALGISHLRRQSLEELRATPTGRARADIMYLERLLRHYTRVVGQPPSTERGLQALVDARIVSAIPLDPWGRPYRYTSRGGVGRVVSLGRDGREGGEGEDADVAGPNSRGP